MDGPFRSPSLLSDNRSIHSDHAATSFAKGTAMPRLPIVLCAALMFAIGQSARGEELDVLHAAPASNVVSIEASLPLSRPLKNTTAGNPTRKRGTILSITPKTCATKPLAHASGYLFQRPASPGRDNVSEVCGIAIQHGTVVLRGQRLESPYVVSRTDKLVLINGEVVATACDGIPGPSELMARIERQLLSGNCVMAFGENIVASIDDEGCMNLIGTLATADSLHRKIELIVHADLQGVEHVTTAEWQTALQEFVPDEVLTQQYLEYESDMESIDAAEDEADAGLQVHDSTRTMYALSVVGMLLIALSAGTLLGNPPKNSGSWSRIVNSPRTLTAMQRCLVLIAAYSLFDLVATLLALKTGYVEEINPLGVGLILAPAALAAFKVSATCLGTGLLWRLKNYHGAQVASWWLCVILTLVTVRWVTVQSLFFV